MKNILKTYKSVIILLAAIIIGAILGMALKENAAVLKPFGDIFLNLLFVTIVPVLPHQYQKLNNLKELEK